MLYLGRGTSKNYLQRMFVELYNNLITRPIRDKRSPHCGAKQRKKYGTPGRYNFAEPTFKNKA